MAANDGKAPNREVGKRVVVFIQLFDDLIQLRDLLPPPRDDLGPRFATRLFIDENAIECHGQPWLRSLENESFRPTHCFVKERFTAKIRQRATPLHRHRSNHQKRQLYGQRQQWRTTKIK